MTASSPPPSGERLRIAVVGSGVAGLSAAAMLHPRHDVTVFEAGDHVGGHVHTLDVEHDGERLAIDTGFIVYNEHNYPNLVRILEHLGVETQATAMSFSVRCETTGLEYNGTNLNGVFAQRRNLVRPRFLGMLRDILRFHREGLAWLSDQEARGRIDDGTSVAAFVSDRRYGATFRDRYLLPIGASIWSCAPGTFADFPVRFVLEFMRHHRMLQVGDRPVWRTVRGGSRAYVERLVAPFADRIRLRTPVRSIRRDAGGADLTTAAGTERFDEVVVACHADTALRLLDDPSPAERDLLGAFPYQANDVVLHTDASLLPRSRRAWAAWNYHVPRTASDLVRVTYDMNILQRLDARHEYCVTLNDDGRIDPARVLARHVAHHPLYTPDRAAAQARHDEVIRNRRTSFCGAYWGFGFHEDGCRSGLRVAEAFGCGLDAWIDGSEARVTGAADAPRSVATGPVLAESAR